MKGYKKAFHPQGRLSPKRRKAFCFPRYHSCSFFVTEKRAHIGYGTVLRSYILPL